MTDGLIVHPRTGEVLERLDRLAPETLADALAAVQERQQQLKLAAGALDDELRRRLQVRDSNFAQFGDYEVKLTPRNRAVWDADELEQALREIADAGVMDAGQMTGIIHTETKVSASAANKLLSRLTEKWRRRVKQAQTWQHDRGTLTVTRSVSLLEGERSEQHRISG